MSPPERSIGRVTQDALPLEETAEDLFENAPCGYVTCGADGTILRVNRTFERWTGYERTTLLGKRFRDLLTRRGTPGSPRSSPPAR